MGTRAGGSPAKRGAVARPRRLPPDGASTPRHVSRDHQAPLGTRGHSHQGPRRSLGHPGKARSPPPRPNAPPGHRPRRQRSQRRRPARAPAGRSAKPVTGATRGGQPGTSHPDTRAPRSHRGQGDRSRRRPRPTRLRADRPRAGKTHSSPRHATPRRRGDSRGRVVPAHGRSVRVAPGPSSVSPVKRGRSALASGGRGARVQVTGRPRQRVDVALPSTRAR